VIHLDRCRCIDRASRANATTYLSYFSKLRLRDCKTYKPAAKALCKRPGREQVTNCICRHGVASFLGAATVTAIALARQLLHEQGTIRAPGALSSNLHELEPVNLR
jgi:hypothetical protein